MARAVASNVYSRTMGYLWGGSQSQADTSEPEADAEYICVDYLNRQSDCFVRWAIKNEISLMSQAKAKLSLQKST